MHKRRLINVEPTRISWYLLRRMRARRKTMVVKSEAINSAGTLPLYYVVECSVV